MPENVNSVKNRCQLVKTGIREDQLQLQEILLESRDSLRPFFLDIDLLLSFHSCALDSVAAAEWVRPVLLWEQVVEVAADVDRDR
jgi:hypothetical protein